MLTGGYEGSKEEVPEGFWIEGGNHCDVLQTGVMQQVLAEVSWIPLYTDLESTELSRWSEECIRWATLLLTAIGSRHTSHQGTQHQTLP